MPWSFLNIEHLVHAEVIEVEGSVKDETPAKFPPSLSRQTLIVHIKHPNPHIHCNISHLLLFYTFFQFQYEFLLDAPFLIQQLNVNVILDFGDKILLQFTPTDNCHIVEVEPSWYSLFAILLHTFPFEHFGDFWKVMLPHREEMSVSATKETLTSLGNQHVCCGAGSCKIQMFFPLFVNGEQEKQWKSKQRGQLGATQFNVHMSCQVSQFKFLYESIILDSAMVFQNLSGLNISPFFKVPWIF